MATISQREARRLRKRVQQLERAEYERRRVWGQEWPGGVNILSCAMTTEQAIAIRVARKLGHAVVVIGDESASVRFMALPHPEVAL